ncbi:MAG: PilZ domain-containing protein [Planctomycetota bacterium]|jgi:hypothetical protein
MNIPSLNILPGKRGKSFLAAARSKGLPSKLAKSLQPAADNLYPEEPESILESRSRFEEAALRSVSKDLTELQLTFKTVEALATAVDTLNLARSGEVPDPFRRVWVQNENGDREKGVAFTCSDGELTVFCPPGSSFSAEIGSEICLSHRGSSSKVAYDLQLNDSVRLPGSEALHLGRRGGGNSAGRVTKRHDVEIMGFIQEQAAADDQRTPIPCKILDISIGGARLECHFQFEKGTPVHLDVFLDDGISEPFSVDCVARWSSSDQDGNQVGLQFGDLSDAHAERLDKAIHLVQE